MSDPLYLKDPLPMRSGQAEEGLIALGAAVVQVRRMLPREADAAVHEDVRSGYVKVRVRGVCLGERGRQRQLLRRVDRGPHGVIRGGSGEFQFDQHVGALVLDRLERADRPAELYAL